MQIMVKHISQELLINTVLLHKNLADPLNVYLFRCYKCSTGLKQIQGLVSAIYAGYIEHEDVATIDRCSKCAENYTFQSTTRQSSTTRLVISTGEGITTFHCINCRMPLLQYNILGAVALPEYIRLDRPGFKCTSPTCSMNYLLKEIVEPVYN